jgi:hypothetical protein
LRKQFNKSIIRVSHGPFVCSCWHPIATFNLDLSSTMVRDTDLVQLTTQKLLISTYIVASEAELIIRTLIFERRKGLAAEALKIGINHQIQPVHKVHL